MIHNGDAIEVLAGPARVRINLRVRKYSDWTIRYVRELAAMGVPRKEIARITGVNRQYVSRLVLGQRRKATHRGDEVGEAPLFEEATHAD